jgi:hypothetical protein
VGKKILFGLLILTGRFLFAQETPRPVLSAENLRGLINNWNSIDRALDDLEDTPQEMVFQEDFKQFLDRCQEFFEGNDDSGDQEFKNSFMEMRAYKVSSRMKGVFSRYGLGPRGFEVFFVSLFGTMAHNFDQAVGSYVEMMESGGIDAVETASEFKQVRLLFNRIRVFKSLIHPQDMALIEEHYEDLKKIINF